MSTSKIKTDINNLQISQLDNMIGQNQVKKTLEMNVNAYFKARSLCNSQDIKFGPAVFTGPSGTGKTMAANIIHNELGNDNFIETNGGAINKANELYSVVLNADRNSTLLIDEAQAMNNKTQQILLTVISENKIYIPAPVKQNCSIELPNFTVIFATTDEDKLLPALLNRMRICCHFELYSIDQIAQIVIQRLNALKWEYQTELIGEMIAIRSKGIPRIALNCYLQTCWNVALTNNHEVITVDDVIEAFEILEIDDLGLNKKDRSYLNILDKYGSSTLNIISSRMAESAPTIQKVIEPYLLREGFIIKTANSMRKITQKGIKHISKQRENDEEQGT